MSLSLSATLPARSRPAAKRRAPRVVELYQVNTREVLPLRYVDDRGRSVKGLQRRADQFFRCHHTGTRGRMNPRLVRLLFEAGRHWPGRRA